MFHFRVLRTPILLLIAGCSFGLLSVVDAAKPTPPPPPPPPPDPFLIYEYRPELGGWLDTQRNLVWGYSLTTVTGSSYTFSSGLPSHVAMYPEHLSNAADSYDARGADMLAKADEEQALADAAYAAGDTVLGDYYQDRVNRRHILAEECFDTADICAEAAQNASQYNNWRLPTKDEAVDASFKGFFSYSDPDFPGWDASPYVGLQSNLANNLYWTSTLTSASGKYVWSFVPATGATSQSTKTSVMWAIVVRTHTP